MKAAFGLCHPHRCSRCLGAGRVRRHWFLQNSCFVLSPGMLLLLQGCHGSVSPVTLNSSTFRSTCCVAGSGHRQGLQSTCPPEAPPGGKRDDGRGLGTAAHPESPCSRSQCPGRAGLSLSSWVHGVMEEETRKPHLFGSCVCSAVHCDSAY